MSKRNKVLTNLVKELRNKYYPEMDPSITFSIGRCLYENEDLYKTYDLNIYHKETYLMTVGKLIIKNDTELISYSSVYSIHNTNIMIRNELNRRGITL